MPGIAGIDTIMHFHNAKMIGDKDSTWGKIEGNPVQGEATEAALMAKPDFMLNVTLNGDKEITNFLQAMSFWRTELVVNMSENIRWSRVKSHSI